MFDCKGCPKMIQYSCLGCYIIFGIVCILHIERLLQDSEMPEYADRLSAGNTEAVFLLTT